MKLKRVGSERNVNKECEIIQIEVGDAVITLKEEHGQLVVFGDGDDLLISCGSRNSFSVVTKKS